MMVVYKRRIEQSPREKGGVDHGRKRPTDTSSSRVQEYELLIAQACISDSLEDTNAIEQE